MIPRRPASGDSSAWREELRRAYRRPRELLAALGLEPADVELDEAAAADFPFRVTRSFAARMRPGDPDDPLLRQVLPVAAETRTTAGFGLDPIGERLLAPRGNLLQKYRGRALLLLTAACAIHCRYCFRRTYPYTEHVGETRLAAGLDAVAADASLSEVILSGGDPLMLDDGALARVLGRLADLPHVRRVRIHSRLPVVLPSRMHAPLLELLAGQRFPVVLVIHANHARELDAETQAALSACRAAGLTVLNQTVLLRGVNDHADAQEALALALFEAGVLPYYVHLLDPVAGAAHFDVDEDRARDIAAALRARLPGYLVPRFVRETAGAPSKLPLAPR